MILAMIVLVVLILGEVGYYRVGHKLELNHNDKNIIEVIKTDLLLGISFILALISVIKSIIKSITK